MRGWICLPMMKPRELVHEVSTVANVNSLGFVPAKRHSYCPFLGQIFKNKKLNKTNHTTFLQLFVKTETQEQKIFSQKQENTFLITSITHFHEAMQSSNQKYLILTSAQKDSRPERHTLSENKR